MRPAFSGGSSSRRSPLCKAEEVGKGCGENFVFWDGEAAAEESEESALSGVKAHTVSNINYDHYLQILADLLLKMFALVQPNSPLPAVYLLAQRSAALLAQVAISRVTIHQNTSVIHDENFAHRRR